MEIALTDQVAFITGAARRVGKQIALALARHGCDIVVHHRASPQEAEETAQEIRAIGRRALVVQGDHSQHEAVLANFESAQAEWGRLDILVNSAGVFPQGDFLSISPAEWEETLHANLSAPFWCSQAAGRLMRQHGRGGCIINIGDNGGVRGWAKRPHHSISKAGVLMLTQVAAKALAAHQIRVNCIVPGPVLPAEDMSPSYWQNVQQRLLLSQAGQPDDVARAVVFLAQNNFITGAILAVDGGEGLGA
jgi:3-oxoacyl-[acyl-carrier protein] reductase